MDESRLLAVVWLIAGLVSLWNQDPQDLNAGGVPNPFLVFGCVFIGLSLGTLIGRRLPLADSVEASVERHRATFTGVYWIVFAALVLWVLSGSSAVVAPVSLGLWFGYLVGAGSNAADEVKQRWRLVADEDELASVTVGMLQQTFARAQQEHSSRDSSLSDFDGLGGSATDTAQTLTVEAVKVVYALVDCGHTDAQQAYAQFREALADQWEPSLKRTFERAWDKVHDVEGTTVSDEVTDEASTEESEQESMTEDDYPSVEESGLSPIEQRAMKYWETFLPQLTKELKAKGPNVLETEIRKAYWEMEHATQLAMIRNPELVRDMAEELFRERLFPPREPKLTQGSGRRIIS